MSRMSLLAESTVTESASLMSAASSASASSWLISGSLSVLSASLTASAWTISSARLFAALSASLSTTLPASASSTMEFPENSLSVSEISVFVVLSSIEASLRSSTRGTAFLAMLSSFDQTENGSTSSSRKPNNFIDFSNIKFFLVFLYNSHWNAVIFCKKKSALCKKIYILVGDDAHY